jgi:NadR type nicotinamide-nucleotide adenylyltransferase
VGALSSLLRVCITGPESTGKTTLARRLAALVGGESVPEASRIYAERIGRELLATDVDPIAREHIALAEAATERANARGARLLVFDTDLVSTVIYARHYYGVAPAWIERAERARRAELYLLCDVDVAWMADGVRDRPVHREEMFGLFHAALARRRATVVTIRGDWDARWATAQQAINSVARRATTKVLSTLY